MSGRQQHQQSFNDSNTASILEEAEKLFNELTTKLINEVITATAAAVGALLLPSIVNVQKLIHKNDNAYIENKER